MKKHGFTLIEMLAVIVVLALIMGIVIVGIGKVIDESRVKTFRTTASSLITGIRNQLSFNEKTEVGDYTFISDIIESGGVMSPFNNQYHYAENANSFCTDSGDTRIGNYICRKGTNQLCSADIDESFVRVTRVDGAYSYSICLTDGEYYIDADEASVLNNAEVKHDVETPTPTPQIQPTNTLTPSSTSSPEIESTDTPSPSPGVIPSDPSTPTPKPRIVTITAPVANSTTLTYNTNNQVLFTSAGSCSTGGTMYWYGEPTTSSTAPTFSTSTWTKTAPALSKANAGTYYLYYYCKVDDTDNNTGTDINKVLSVSKSIDKLKAIAPTLTAATVTYDGSSHCVSVSGGTSGLTKQYAYRTWNGSSYGSWSGWGTTSGYYCSTGNGQWEIKAKVVGNDNYSDSAESGAAVLTISSRAITCTSNGGSKTYDGTALTNTTGGSCTNLPSGHTATFSNAGSQTNAGSSSNTVGVTIKNSSGTNVSSYFSITKSAGTLTVSTRATTCTSNGGSKTYDGTALTNTTGGSCTNLPSGHTATFSNTGSQTNAGSSNNTVGVTIKNSSGTNVNSSFSITTSAGTLTVNRATTTMTLSKYTVSETCNTRDANPVITTNGDGTLSCTSDKTSVATCSISSNLVVINPLKKGTAKLTISQAKGTNYAATSKVIDYTVTSCWKYKKAFDSIPNCTCSGSNCCHAACGGTPADTTSVISPDRSRCGASSSTVPKKENYKSGKYCWCNVGA